MSSSDASEQKPRFAKFPEAMRWPEGVEVKTFKASCHCGKFKYEFSHPPLDVKNPIRCNCTFCTKTGSLNVFGPENILSFDESSAPRDELSTFKAKLLPTTHHFCPGCGCYLFWNGMGFVGINSRMIEGIELEKLTTIPADGRSRKQ